MIARLLLLLPALALADSAVHRDINDLSWLAGHWSSSDGTRVVEEQWLAPAAGVMLGVGRTTRGEDLELQEFLRIQRQDGRVTYVPYPNGEKSVSFPAIALGEGHVVFANPDHDFPQHIEYRLTDTGRLEITLKGGDKHFSYTLERR